MYTPLHPPPCCPCPYFSQFSVLVRWMRSLELEAADAVRHTGILARMKKVTKVRGHRSTVARTPPPPPYRAITAITTVHSAAAVGIAPVSQRLQSRGWLRCDGRGVDVHAWTRGEGRVCVCVTRLSRGCVVHDAPPSPLLRRRSLCRTTTFSRGPCCRATMARASCCRRPTCLGPQSWRTPATATPSLWTRARTS